MVLIAIPNTLKCYGYIEHYWKYNKKIPGMELTSALMKKEAPTLR